MSEYEAHSNRAKMVSKLIGTCNRCELGSANRVQYGGVTWQPKLILLGEAPGRHEDEAGEPFVGAAGRLLDRMLGMVGLSRHRVMIANTVCCRPPSNRDPSWEEIQACSFNRASQIRLGRTWVGVSMGKIALSTLLEEPGNPIGAFKGKPLWKDDMVWVPTYHPAYALRNKNAVAEIASHFKMALDIKQGNVSAPRPPTSDYQMVGDVLIVDHEDVKVPHRVRELSRVTFTKEEWAKMRYVSHETSGAVERVKQILGGQVVR